MLPRVYLLPNGQTFSVSPADEEQIVSVRQRVVLEGRLSVADVLSLLERIEQDRQRAIPPAVPLRTIFQPIEPLRQTSSRQLSAMHRRAQAAEGRAERAERRLARVREQLEAERAERKAAERRAAEQPPTDATPRQERREYSPPAKGDAGQLARAHADNVCAIRCHARDGFLGENAVIDFLAGYAAARVSEGYRAIDQGNGRWRIESPNGCSVHYGNGHGTSNALCGCDSCDAMRSWPRD